MELKQSNSSIVHASTLNKSKADIGTYHDRCLGKAPTREFWLERHTLCAKAMLRHGMNTSASSNITPVRMDLVRVRGRQQQS